MKTGSSSSASFTSHNPWSVSNPRMDSTSKRYVISDVVPALHSPWLNSLPATEY